MIKLAFRADDPYVQKNRWIATLSNGQTIFEDKMPNEENAWRRLAQYLQQERAVITSLRCEVYGQNILVHEYDSFSPEGHWHSKAIELNSLTGELLSYGVGYIRDRKVHITWIHENGSTEEEVRDYDAERDFKIGAGILSVADNS